VVARSTSQRGQYPANYAAGTRLDGTSDAHPQECHWESLKALLKQGESVKSVKSVKTVELPAVPESIRNLGSGLVEFKDVYRKLLAAVGLGDKRKHLVLVRVKGTMRNVLNREVACGRRVLRITQELDCARVDQGVLASKPALTVAGWAAFLRKDRFCKQSR
jgi:hypothetical protein